jgi:hypothetical protein
MRNLISLVVMFLVLFLSTVPSQEIAIPIPQGEGYTLKKEATRDYNRWELKIVSPASGAMPSTERVIFSPESFYLSGAQLVDVSATFSGGTLTQLTIPRLANIDLDKYPVERHIKNNQPVIISKDLTGISPASGGPAAPATAMPNTTIGYTTGAFGYGGPGLAGMIGSQGAPGTRATNTIILPNNILSDPVKVNNILLARAFLEAYNQVLATAPRDEPIEYVIYRASWQLWYNQSALWGRYVDKEILLKPGAPAAIEKRLDFASRDALNNSVAFVANYLQKNVRDMDDADLGENLNFWNRLEERRYLRNDYHQWLIDQKEVVGNYTKDWISNREGREVAIEGTIYLISREPIENIPRNAVNLVTTKLTPYDLLNADGTLKKPEQ